MVKLPDAMKIYHCLFIWLGKHLIKPAGAMSALLTNTAKYHLLRKSFPISVFQRTLLKYLMPLYVI